MRSKIYIFLYIYFFIGVQFAPFAGSEEKNETNIVSDSNSIDFEEIIASDSNSIDFEKIEEADIFEPEENRREIKSLNAKKWTIKMKLGPFKSKNDAQQALNNIKIDSSDKLFGTDIQSPISNLSKKVFSFEIIEVDSLMEPNKKLSQVKLKNRNLKNIDEKFINSAHEEGVDWQEINRKYIKDFHENMDKLDIASLAEEPKVIKDTHQKLPIPSDSSDSKYMVEVVTSGMPLRVRENPLITSPVIYRVKNGSRFISVEEPTLDEAGDWVRIEYVKGEFGWISKTYSKITDFLESKLVDKNIDAKNQAVIEEFNVAQLHNWMKAWENREVQLYLSFYSENFKGYKENRTVWEASRRQALTSRSSMTIEAKNIDIITNNKKVKVSFIQIFKSEDYEDIGNKVLEWKKAGSDWKIVKETWSSL